MRRSGWRGGCPATRRLRGDVSGPVQQRYDQLVRSCLWPGLKALGFKRSKATFHRAVGPNWEVINLQKSAYSDSAHVRFTVNLGVGIERLRTGRWDWGETKRPSVGQCRFQRRLGQLMVGEDVWWDLTEETELATLDEAVSLALERYGLPWLSERSTDEGLRDQMLAELASVYDHELVFLAELLDQLGPPSALDDVKREQARRTTASG